MKEWKGLRSLGKNLREPRGRKKPEGSQVPRTALCPGGFPGGMPANFPGRMPGMERGVSGMAGMPGLHENLSDPEVLAGMPDP